MPISMCLLVLPPAMNVPSVSSVPTPDRDSCPLSTPQLMTPLESTDQRATLSECSCCERSDGTATERCEGAESECTGSRLRPGERRPADSERGCLEGLPARRDVDRRSASAVEVGEVVADVGVPVRGRRRRSRGLRRLSRPLEESFGLQLGVGALAEDAHDLVGGHDAGRLGLERLRWRRRDRRAFRRCASCSGAPSRVVPGAARRSAGSRRRTGTRVGRWCRSRGSSRVRAWASRRCRRGSRGSHRSTCRRSRRPGRFCGCGGGRSTSLREGVCVAGLRGSPTVPTPLRRPSIVRWIPSGPRTSTIVRWSRIGAVSRRIGSVICLLSIGGAGRLGSLVGEHVGAPEPAGPEPERDPGRDLRDAPDGGVAGGAGALIVCVIASM
jgi:hypothetical protein